MNRPSVSQPPVKPRRCFHGFDNKQCVRFRTYASRSTLPFTCPSADRLLRCGPCDNKELGSLGSVVKVLQGLQVADSVVSMFDWWYLSSGRHRRLPPRRRRRQHQACCSRLSKVSSTASANQTGMMTTACRGWWRAALDITAANTACNTTFTV